jgi:hypothetical protein
LDAVLEMFFAHVDRRMQPRVPSPPHETAASGASEPHLVSIATGAAEPAELPRSPPVSAETVIQAGASRAFNRRGHGPTARKNRRLVVLVEIKPDQWSCRLTAPCSRDVIHSSPPRRRHRP